MIGLMYKVGALEDKSWGLTFSTPVDKAKLGTERRSRSSLRPELGHQGVHKRDAEHMVYGRFSFRS